MMIYRTYIVYKMMRGNSEDRQEIIIMSAIENRAGLFWSEVCLLQVVERIFQCRLSYKNPADRSVTLQRFLWILLFTQLHLNSSITAVEIAYTHMTNESINPLTRKIFFFCSLFSLCFTFVLCTSSFCP